MNYSCGHAEPSFCGQGWALRPSVPEITHPAGLSPECQCFTQIPQSLTNPPAFTQHSQKSELRGGKVLSLPALITTLPMTSPARENQSPGREVAAGRRRQRVSPCPVSTAQPELGQHRLPSPGKDQAGLPAPLLPQTSCPSEEPWAMSSMKLKGCN